MTALNAFIYYHHLADDPVISAWPEGDGNTIRLLTSFAEQYGLSGDLWPLYLTFLLMRDENPYSLLCEAVGLPEGSMAAMARQDFQALYALLHCRGQEKLASLQEYAASAKNKQSFAEGSALVRLCQQLCQAEDAEALQQFLSRWYHQRGVGALGVFPAFQAVSLNGSLTLRPLRYMVSIRFDQLVGYQLQKETLCQNIEAFLRGLPANDMLLYGDAGTGKSSSVKALLSEYADQRLRIVELAKPDFSLLGELISLLGDRPYRFLIFMDDLSFEENEIEYKQLKAVIEGGISGRPENVLLCATSNRRHIVREIWKDRSDMEYTEDVHRSDTMEEKLSLAARFGCQINYSIPDRTLYHQIVCSLAREAALQLPEADLLRQADAWEIRHGGVSGRVARQFIHHLQALQQQED